MFYPRRLPRFEYLAPRSIEEALFMLFQHGKEARVIAGGTDLLPQMKKRELAPRYLIGLKNIGGLDYIDYDPARGLRVGPLATLHAVETSPTVNERFPALAQATYSMASAQIRNMGTVVGNICNAVPSAFLALIGVGATAPRAILTSLHFPSAAVMAAATPTIARSIADLCMCLT